MQENIINLQYTIIKDPLPEFIFNDLKEYSKNANGYKPQPQELIEMIAKKHSIPEEMICLTAGIDEAIQMYAKAYGVNTYIFTPTYLVYADVKEFGGNLNEIPALEGVRYRIKTDKIPNASLIFLANPNNPAGITSKEEVIKLIKNNTHAKVVIDEAYGDFANLSVIDQVEKYPHVSVFRSFSKSYGMAGNRVGYIIAHKDVLQVVKNKTQWANVSYLSVGAAVSALNHEDYFKKMREGINMRREKFSNFLKENDFHIIPSGINAVLIKLASEAEGNNLFDYLYQNKVLTSYKTNNNSNIGLDGSFLRIAIGTEEQMEVCKKLLKNWKTKQSPQR